MNTGSQQPSGPSITLEDSAGYTTHNNVVCEECQTWLVQEFCDAGTFSQAIHGNKYRKPDGATDTVSCMHTGSVRWCVQHHCKCPLTWLKVPCVAVQPLVKQDNG